MSLLFKEYIAIALFVSCTGIKKYIVGLVIKLASDATAQEKVFLAKLDIILVQVSTLVIESFVLE